MDGTNSVVVIGAGQAGLGVSYLLRERGIQHVVLERGNVGESWRSQRWDSFHLNTPNWANDLPGMAFDAERPDAFAHRDALLSYFERYVQGFDLPVRPHTAVHKVERLPAGDYSVECAGARLHARAVVLASGGMSRPRVPGMARRLSSSVVSMSTAEYRNPGSLPDGAVVVVGSGQSGCQIVEDLLAAGRQVFLCASRVGRVPRVYRGRDILAWWREMGLLDVGLEQLEDPAIQFAPQPQVSGTDGGHTVSLQSLARDGATLLGRVTEVDPGGLSLGMDLRSTIAFADEKSRSFKAAIDAWIDRQGIDVEPPEPDPGEPPLPDLQGSDRLDRLDLARANIGCVIWCTGFDADWSWVKPEVFDGRSRPRHRHGMTDSPGLYFVGLPWLSSRKSGILYGIAEDAARVVDDIERRVLGTGGS